MQNRFKKAMVANEKLLSPAQQAEFEKFIGGADTRSGSPSNAAEVDKDTSGNYRKIHLSLLDENPFNPRVVYREATLLELGKNMQKEGLKKPILVIAKPDGRFMVVDGHRRWKSADLVGWPEIEAKVDESLTINDSPEHIYSVAYALNEQSEKMSDIEKAIRWKTLVTDHAFTLDQIARVANIKSVSTVSEIISMAELPRTILDYAIDNASKLSSSLVREIRAVVVGNSEEAAMELAKRIVEDDLSVREARKLAVAQRPRNRAARMMNYPIYRTDQQLGEVKVYADGRLQVQVNGLSEEDIQKAGERIAQAITKVLAGTDGQP